MTVSGDGVSPTRHENEDSPAQGRHSTDLAGRHCALLFRASCSSPTPDLRVVDVLGLSKPCSSCFL